MINKIYLVTRKWKDEWGYNHETVIYASHKKREADAFAKLYIDDTEIYVDEYNIDTDYDLKSHA